MKHSYLTQLILPVVGMLFVWAIFVPHLGRTIQYDEAYTYLQYAQSPITALFVYTAPNNHLLHSLLVWLSTSFIGDSLIAIRLPALLSGLLAVAMLYRVGRQVLGIEAGLLAFSFLVAIPMFGSYFINARGYTLVVFLSLTYFWIICITNPTKLFLRKWGRSLFSLSILLLLTLPTMILLIFPLILYVLAFRKKHFWQLYLIPIIFGTIIGLLFYIPPLIFGYLSEFSSQFGYASPISLWVGFANTLGTEWFIILIGVGFLFSLFLSSPNKKESLVKPVIYVLIFAILMSVLQYWLTQGVLFPRNYIYLLPFIALLSAKGWTAFVNRWVRNSLVTYGLIVGLLLFAGLQYQSLSEMSNVDNLDQTLKEYANANDLFVIGCCLDFPIYYHYRDQQNFTAENPPHRLIIIPTNYDSFIELQEAYALGDIICEETMWDEFIVFTCTL